MFWNKICTFQFALVPRKWEYWLNPVAIQHTANIRRYTNESLAMLFVAFLIVDLHLLLWATKISFGQLAFIG